VKLSNSGNNPLLDAVYDMSDSADDAAIDELLWLARETTARLMRVSRKDAALWHGRHQVT
jgi:hypothetical protein